MLMVTPPVVSSHVYYLSIRSDVAVSLLSGVLEDVGGALQQPSMWYLLLMKALLINGDYDRCWGWLCRVIKYLNTEATVNTEATGREHTLVICFQICYLGCFLSLHLHKVQLAEIFGYR